MDKQKKREKTLKIISLFREHEPLWNRNSILYRRNDVKKKALAEIAQQCNMTEECVKKKLKALRGTYVIEKKKVEQSKNSGCDPADVYEPALFWYKEMSFLDCLISTRKPKDNVSNNIQEDSYYLDEASSSKSFESDVSCAPTTSRKKKCKKDIDTDKFDEAINKIININTPIEDAFSTFGDSVAMTLRSMPEQTAYLTMIEIQELLFQRKFNTEVVTRSEHRRRTSSTDSRDANLLLSFKREDSIS